MRDLFISELKCIYKEHQFTEEEKQILVNEANRLFMMAEIAREEGLLALSYMIEGNTWVLDGGADLNEKYGIVPYSINGFEQYLGELVDILVDGTDADIICKIAELNLCKARFSPEEYIRYLMAVDVILQIKFGLVSHMIKKIIDAYLPVGINP